MRVIIVAALLAACAHETEITLEVTPEPMELVMGEITHNGIGSFTVHVTATTDEDTADRNLQSLAVELQVSTAVGSSTAVTKGALIRSGDHAFKGTFAQSWPQGGPIEMTVRAGGVQQSTPLIVNLPELELAPAIPVPDAAAANASLKFCVVSTTTAGSVSVHLQDATFMTMTPSDATAPLVRGPCPIAGAVTPAGFEALSHAAFTLTSQSSAPTVAVSLANPIAGAPPLATILARTFPLVIPAAVNAIAFQSPPATAAPGTLVTLQVKASSSAGPVKGVTLTFQASSELTFIPPSPKTDSAGLASTSFVMPNLGGALLLLGVAGGGEQDDTTIAN